MGRLHWTTPSAQSYISTCSLDHAGVPESLVLSQPRTAQSVYESRTCLSQRYYQNLAKYVVSPPISVKRIENYDGKSVSYWYRDHKTEQVEHETIPALEFIGRMAQHILPKGFQRIRYYGLHGNVRYKKMREQLKDIIPANTPDDPKGYRVLPAKAFQQRFFESFDIVPEVVGEFGNS